MENSGCDVSKNAADVILLDDSFTTLVDGIERCRSSLRNIEKMTLYLLTSNLAEICPFVMLVIFQIPPPLSISFVLCISLGTDLYAEISFAF
jgi:P-type E1-E2 ATPase